jgi:hypothetical protein
MEIQSIGSVSAVAREAHSPRADEADKRLTGSEKGGARLGVEVEILYGRCDNAQKRAAAQKDDTSMIKESPDQLKSRVSQLQQSPVPAPQIRLLIVREFPPFFDEFRAKRFNSLLQGSRDRFTAGQFHRCCDGHANTLTLIADTDGNVFGGFTPVEWESNDYWK